MMLSKIILLNFFLPFERLFMPFYSVVPKFNNARNSQKEVPKDNFGKHHQNQHNCSTLVLHFQNEMKLLKPAMIANVDSISYPAAGPVYGIAFHV
jgi:hypothetical protein